VQIKALQMLGPGDIFTRQEALARGLSGRGLTKLVRAGNIARVGNGVYRNGTVADVRDPRAISRAMRAPVSHASSAAWLGAELPFAPTRLHLTAERSRGRRADCVEGVRLHRADLAPSEVVIVRGVEVTGPVRTVLDIARSMPVTEAVAIGDSMCRLGHTTPAEIETAAIALASGPGRQAAVNVAQFLDPRAESVFVSITRVEMAIGGLPAPTPQLNIIDRNGVWIARVDFAWPELRLILECDGFEFHGNREAFERDRRRWSALTRAGWRIVIVTWRDVLGDPTYLVELARDVIASG
jgi:hypothetical protein